MYVYTCMKEPCVFMCLYKDIMTDCLNISASCLYLQIDVRARVSVRAPLTDVFLYRIPT